MKRKIILRPLIISTATIAVNLMLLGPTTSAAVGLATRKKASHMGQAQVPLVEEERFLLPESQYQTPMGFLADEFEGVLDGNEIVLPKLLRACYKLEETMRSLGQTSSANDFHSNVEKVEKLLQQAPADRRHTMYALLSYEKSLGIHPPREGSKRRLRDPSAAMGLLWIERSLSFNHAMYSEVLRQAEPVKAAMNAYQTVLEPFHSWTLRKLSAASIQHSTPARDQLFAQLAGNRDEDPYLKATQSDLCRLLNHLGPLIRRWRETFQELDLDDNRKV